MSLRSRASAVAVTAFTACAFMGASASTAAAGFDDAYFIKQIKSKGECQTLGRVSLVLGVYQNYWCIREGGPFETMGWSLYAEFA